MRTAPSHVREPREAARAASAIVCACALLACTLACAQSRNDFIGARAHFEKLGVIVGPGSRRDITSLDLLDVPLTDDQLAPLRAFPALRRLAIRSAGIGDAGLSHLRSLRRLESLYLSRLPITGPGFAHLSELPLRELTLNGMRLDAAHLSRLCAIQTLQILELSGTRWGDAGLGELAACSRIRHLDLTYTRLTPDDLRALAGFTELRTLYLSAGYVSPDDVARLRRLLPRVEVRII